MGRKERKTAKKIDFNFSLAGLDFQTNKKKTFRLVKSFTIMALWNINNDTAAVHNIHLKVETATRLSDTSFDSVCFANARQSKYLATISSVLPYNRRIVVSH